MERSFTRTSVTADSRRSDSCTSFSGNCLTAGRYSRAKKSSIGRSLLCLLFSVCRPDAPERYHRLYSRISCRGMEISVSLATTRNRICLHPAARRLFCGRDRDTGVTAMIRPSASPHDVFISYSSHDKPIADAVCATVEGKTHSVLDCPARCPGRYPRQPDSGSQNMKMLAVPAAPKR